MDEGPLPPEVRIVVDTGVFFRPAALRRLAEVPYLVVVPAVAFAERVRQLAKKGVAAEDFHALLDRLGFHVEPFGAEEALRVAPHVKDDAEWRRLARDALIAGHLRAGDLLWTTDPEDFLRLGVPKEQVLAVP